MKTNECKLDIASPATPQKCTVRRPLYALLDLTQCVMRLLFTLVIKIHRISQVSPLSVS